jgi:hypothetical protein
VTSRWTNALAVAALWLLLCWPAKAAVATTTPFAARLVSTTSGTETIGTAMFVNAAGTLWLLTAYHNFRGAGNDTAAKTNAHVVLSPTDSKQSFPLDQLTTAQLCVRPRLGTVGAQISAGAAAKLMQLGVKFAKLDPSRASGNVLASGNPQVTILNEEVHPFDFVGSGTIGSNTSTAGTLLPNEAINEVAEKTPLLFITGITITHGYSGGPVFAPTSTNVVSGLVMGGDSSANESWAIPSDELLRDFSSTDGCQTVGVADGFKDHLFASEQESLLKVIAFTPNPLRLPLNRDTPVSISVDSAGSAAANAAKEDLHFVPDVAKVRGITFVRGLEPGVDSQGTVNFVFELRADPDVQSEHIELPCVVRRNNGQILGNVNLSVEIETPPYFAAVVSPGLLVPVTGPIADRSTHPIYSDFTIGVGVNWRLANPHTVVGFRFGGGLALLYADRRTFDPRGREVLDKTAADLLLGPRVQLLAEMRGWDMEPVGLRWAVGTSWERFSFAVPDSASDSTRFHQWSLFTELGPTFYAGGGVVIDIRLLRLAVQWPPFLDTRYVGLTSLAAVPSAPSLSLGAGIGLDWGTR